MTAGMAFEALNNAGVARRRPAGDPERQRHVDLAAGRRAEPLPRAADERQVLRRRARHARKNGAEERAAAVRAGQALRGARQGHGRARHDVRGVRLQLHRPDRRPRPRLADPDAARTCKQPEGPAVPARRHARRARATSWPRPTRCSTTGPASSIRPRASSSRRRRRKTDLHAGLRPLAVRHGRAGRAPGRHHAGDARRLGHGRVRASASRPLLRRRHRRAARGDLRRRPRLRRA